MDRTDFYFRQLVTESEMDLTLDQVQDRIEAADSQGEHGFDGMVDGGGVTESSPPALTVDVDGPAIGYLPDGKRVSWPLPETIDVSQDKLGAPTAVGTPGNSKILSVFVEFDEDLQDLRIDGNSLPVYWKRLADHNIYVLQSAESVTPTPVSLQSDALLLCDVSLAYGQTTIVNANIDLSRRQDTYRNEGNFLSDIVEGRIRDALGHLHDDFNQFAEDIDSNDAGKGAALVGVDAYSATPTGGSALGFTDTDLQSALEDLVTDLTGAPGSTKIGAAAKTGSNVTLPTPLSLSATNVDNQMADLLDYMETIRNTPFSASAVSYSPHDYVASTDVQAAIDELIDDLQSTAGGSGAGSYEIGYKGVTQALHSSQWTDANIAAGSVEASLDTLAYRSAGCLQRFGDTSAGFFSWTNSYPFLFNPSSVDLTLRHKNTGTVRANLVWNFSFEGSDGIANPMVINGAGDMTLTGEVSAVDLGLSGNVVSDLIPSGTRDLGASGSYWTEAYATDIYTVDVYLQELNKIGSNTFIEVDLTTGESFRPKTTGVVDLGETSYRWRDIWANNNVYGSTFSGSFVDVGTGRFGTTFEPILMDQSDSLGRTKWIVREDTNAGHSWSDVTMGLRIRLGSTDYDLALMERYYFSAASTDANLGKNASPGRWNTLYVDKIDCSSYVTLSPASAPSGSSGRLYTESDGSLRSYQNLGGSGLQWRNVGEVQHARVTISQANWNQLNASPYTLVAAQGANTFIVVHQCVVHESFNTTNPTGGSSLQLYMAGFFWSRQGPGPTIFTSGNYDKWAAFIIGGQSTYANEDGSSASFNQPLQLRAASTEYTGGDNTFYVDTWYSVMSVP